ncbi:fumble-domain-containing protein [Dunaliella salina]|uniref:Fumble-domain-containing protein n=1 Tax=Dunaliella salina TaxID=3046 RepID=A0ABQ7G412_DUNSA|nr:fumble-domain-containing protein [Dunaliella salina]|eukprot:KAF5829353.1 fumble-domain-containing protein [Dunaliella salina]
MSSLPGEQGSPVDPGGSPPVSDPSGSTLDLTGASIREVVDRQEPAPSIELPNQDADYISHIALDIGGTLIKLVYFSPDPPSDHPTRESPTANIRAAAVASRIAEGIPATHQTVGSTISRGGRLHFVKFESSRVEDAIQFIEAKGLHRCKGSSGHMRVKATGGGAHKYSEIFKEKLGVLLEKEDEMMCLVRGCNFFLKAITHEAFTFENGTTSFVPTNEEGDLYPYLLVNIGSGVSMVKVTGENQFERVSGSSLGGGTFSGLCHLLTQRKDFDEMLELSMQGDNSKVDMLVGDIYGGRDYSNIGLSANTIASSFGKVISQDAPLSDYDPADISMALCRMVSYNIGQLAYLNAIRYNIKRIFFGGFFIRGHPYTMETISYAIRFWSKGEMAAMFLRHEGFLGAMGAFLKVHPMTPPGRTSAGAQQPQKVRARFVERFSMGAPFAGGEVVGPAISDLQEKVSWVEKFVAQGGLRSASHGPGASRAAGTLLERALAELIFLYEPNTFGDVSRNEDEWAYWLKILEDQIPTIGETSSPRQVGL